MLFQGYALIKLFKSSIPFEVQGCFCECIAIGKNVTFCYV